MGGHGRLGFESMSSFTPRSKVRGRMEKAEKLKSTCSHAAFRGAFGSSVPLWQQSMNGVSDEHAQDVRHVGHGGQVVDYQHVQQLDRQEGEDRRDIQPAEVDRKSGV